MEESPGVLTVDELFIKDTIDLLIARKDEISIRFSVQIRIEKPDVTVADGCWVNIHGNEDKVKLAKVSSSESYNFAHFPRMEEEEEEVRLHQHLFTNSDF